MSKIALIPGVTGQDGAYLAQLLLEKDFTFYGIYRRTSSVNFSRVEELGIQNHPYLHLVEYDLTDLGSNIALVQKVQSDEIYNLAAQSFVSVSFNQPTTTAQITGMDAHYACGRHPVLTAQLLWLSQATICQLGARQQ